MRTRSAAGKYGARNSPATTAADLHRAHATLPFLLVALTLSIWLTTVSAVGAHSVLERSDPPANAALDGAARQVKLSFTEPIDPTFSSVTVLDSRGKRVSQGTLISEDRRQIRASLDIVTRGIYTVKWGVLSAIDGHTTSGFFVFAVGQTVPSSLGGAGVAAPRPSLVAARWISFLTALLLAGSTLFPLAMFRPGLPGIDPQEAAAMRATLERRLRGLQIGAGLALLLSVAAELGLTATTLFDVPLSELTRRGLMWPLLAGTRIGWSALVRMAFAVLFLLPATRRGQILQSAGLILFIGIAGLAILFRGPAALTSPSHLGHLTLIVLVSSVYGLMKAIRRPPEVNWVPVLAAIGILGGMTLSAHASGGGGLAVVVDWMHLLAAGAWVGGLASLLLVLNTAGPPDRRQVAQILVPRFSRLAALSLLVLLLTGGYSAWLHVPALRALAVTVYGRTLLVKLLIILPLVVLGAFNHFLMRPRLETLSDPARHWVQRRFRVAVGVEVILAVGVVLATAVLTQVPPARVTLPTSAQSRLVLAGLTADIQVRLSIIPALPDWNRFEVGITGRDGRPIGGEARVLLRLTKLDEDLVPTTVPLAYQEQGQYVAESGKLRLPGWWEIEVVVRRQKHPDALVAFPLRLGRPPATSDAAARRLVEQANALLAALQTWREEVELTDGAGNVAVTRYELMRPNRLHYWTSTGNEAIVIGSTRYLRNEAGRWEQDTLSAPLVVEGPFLQYLNGARSIGRGRQAQCDGELCQVVTWRSGQTAFAALIGMQTRRVDKLLMVAPSHYMTVRVMDFNAPLKITPP